LLVAETGAVEWTIVPEAGQDAPIGLAGCVACVAACEAGGSFTRMSF
jgi:hypothetical protein